MRTLVLCALFAAAVRAETVDVCDLYRLEAKRHVLNEVPQELHFVGVPGTVTLPLTLYTDRTRKTVFARLSKGGKVTVLLASGRWYLVKTAAGLTGWAPEEALYRSLQDLPLAD